MNGIRFVFENEPGYEDFLPFIGKNTPVTVKVQCLESPVNPGQKSFNILEVSDKSLIGVPTFLLKLNDFLAWRVSHDMKTGRGYQYRIDVRACNGKQDGWNVRFFKLKQTGPVEAL